MTSTPDVELFPDGSPNGEGIVFTMERNSNLDLFGLDMASGTVTRLTDAPHRDVWPRFSPDGRYLAFFSHRDTDGEDDELYVMAADGSGIRRITTRPGHDLCPTWSPDGKRLAAASTEPRGIAVSIPRNAAARPR